jgi:carboxyl-terminal processing protease
MIFGILTNNLLFLTFEKQNSMKRTFLHILFLGYFSLTAQNPYFEIAKQMEIYNDALKKLSTNYIDEINFGDLIQKNTKRTLNGLDRFTTFYDEQGILDQKMRQEGHFGGLGVNIQIKDSVILITNIYKDTPAAKSLVIGDEIREIEGKKIYELDKKVASELLRGEKGSKVKIVIKRNGKIIRKEIERDDIPLDAVTITDIIDDTGYIRFVKFNKKAASQVKKAILDLKQKGAKKLIIDIRDNPGGLLNEVVKIVNFFIPKGKIVVTTKGRFAKYNKTYTTKYESLDEEIPIVILVNNRSASASEILSGTLQDYDRAVIIGDTTYGKGLVQRTYPLIYGTYMKQTISKYYIPSGRLIQKIDYWHRDKNGKPLLMRDNLPEKNYKTTNGRTVHNLGGIVPDIIIDNDINNSLIRDLIKKNYLFDFATWYYYNRPKPENKKIMKLTDADFELFIKYLHQNGINPESSAENILQKAYKKAEKEKQDASVLKKYQELLDMYDQIDEQVIRHHKDEILYRINTDLNNRYGGLENKTRFLLQHDPVILKAFDILKDLKKYNKILEGK